MKRAMPIWKMTLFSIFCSVIQSPKWGSEATSKIAIEGRGEADPVTGTQCDGVKGKNELITCLAPDRRVEVRVSGVQEVQQ